jgi:hypothetical protein
MEHAIIGAFLMTFMMSLLGTVVIWGSCRQSQGYNDAVKRYKQGLAGPSISALLTQSAMPRSWESLWRASPSLVLSGVYTCLSFIFAYSPIDLSGPQPLSKRSFASKFWWICAHTSPQERFIGCGIWLIPLVVAVFIFMRSVPGYLQRKNNSPAESN